MKVYEVEDWINEADRTPEPILPFKTNLYKSSQQGTTLLIPQRPSYTDLGESDASWMNCRFYQDDPTLHIYNLVPNLE